MTTTTSTPQSESTHNGLHPTRPSNTVRYVAAGIALLAVAVGSLVGAVTDWSQVATSGFVGNHYLQLIAAVLGCALVVSGIATGRRQR